MIQVRGEGLPIEDCRLHVAAVRRGVYGGGSGEAKADAFFLYEMHQPLRVVRAPFLLRIDVWGRVDKVGMIFRV